MYPALSPAMNAGANMYGTRRISVVRMSVQTAGTYADQWLRPMTGESRMTGHVQNMIENVLATKPAMTPQALAVPALTLLSPSAAPETRVNIVNGWATPRYRFMLQLEVEDNMGHITDHYYSGYSDVSDASISGLVDPKSVFTIVNHTSAKRIHRETTMGVQMLRTPVAHDQILTADNYRGLADPNKTFSLRPETVLESVINQDLRSVEDLFIDTSSIVSQPTHSARKNNSPADYLSRILGTYRNSIGDLSADMNDPRAVSLENAKSILQSDVGEDPFSIWLQHRRLRGAGGLDLGVVMGMNQFNLNDLKALDDTALTRVTNFDKMVVQRDFHEVGNSECSRWSDSTLEAQTASLIAQALPTYLNSYNFSFSAVSATNQTLTGELTVVCSPTGINAGADTRPFIAALEQRLRTELFHVISKGNSMPIDINVICDLNGETWVHLSLAGRGRESFVCPTFCDSLFAPTITKDKANLERLASDFSGIFEMIDHINGQQHNNILAANSPTTQFFTPSANPSPVLPVQPATSPAPAIFLNQNPGF